MPKKQVIVEMLVSNMLPAGTVGAALTDDMQSLHGLQIDPSYAPVSLPPPAGAALSLTESNQQVVAVRGTVDESQLEALQRDPRVVKVWTDAPLAPHIGQSRRPAIELALTAVMGPCPCPPCDCDSSETGAKGTLSDVVKYLGVDRLWAAGYKGDGIVIGVCDSGVHRGEVPALIDGWSPPNAPAWGDNNAFFHGTMCAVDVLGVCPNAKILDIGVLKSQSVQGTGPFTGQFGGLTSDALAAYDWVLNRYQRTGTPQVVTNSWGMPQKSSAPDYATDADHPFTRKVAQVIAAGVLVCFSAGNGGQRCPSQVCGSDTGPGKSIWGANGHPAVLTVGAANIKDQWIGYSSQGPAALDPRKPDVCAPSHYKGYTANDNGTSAACPIAAGVLGLLRQAVPSLRQDRAKQALQQTSKDICAPGWDACSGYGIIQAAAAAAWLGVLGQPLVAPPSSATQREGVQFKGTVPANSTGRWRTDAWPAAWDVLFFVLPTAPPAGASQPQLKWTVLPERASADTVTYWIDLTNVSGSEVPFEARYLVVNS